MSVKTLPETAVLLPRVPRTWASQWHVAAGESEAWTLAGAALEPVIVHAPPPPSLRRRLERARNWVIPYGALNQGILLWLTQYCPRTDARLIVFTNGEGCKGGIHLIAHRQGLRASDLIVTTCRAETALLRSYFPGSRVETSPLALSAKPYFRPLPPRARSELRKSLGLAPSDPLLVYAGRVSLQKNLHLLIAAFARVRKRRPRARLRILGAFDGLGLPHLGIPAPGNYALQLSELAWRLGVLDAIEFEGHVDPERLRGLLSACDAHVSLSTHFGEDFGLSIAQGLALGAPTVATRWGGHRDAIMAGVALPVPVEIREGMPALPIDLAADRMLDALEPRRSLELREAARAYAREFFHPRAVALRLRSLASLPEGSQAGPLLVEPGIEALIRRSEHARGATLFASERDPSYLRIVQEYSKPE